MARSYWARLLMAMRFQALIWTAARVSQAISSSLKWAFRASKLSFDAPLSAIRVTSSIQASAARSFSE